MRRVLLGLAMLFLNGCSAVDLLNVAALRNGVPVAASVAYEPGDRHTLDVYAPKGASGAPVVVFFYGGGWEDGSKADYRFVGGALADRGFVAILPDYRVYPEVRFPDFLRDSAAAVAWAKAHAAAYGGDPDRLVLMGHSAGAYNAAMLAIDPQWLGEVGLDPRRDVAALVGLSGPYDFLPLHSAVLKAIFGPPETLAQTQPITFVAPGTPPMLLATGKTDDTVDPGNASRLAARVRAAGGSADVIIYPSLSHRTIVGALALPLRFLAPVLDDVAGFVNKQTIRRPLRVKVSG